MTRRQGVSARRYNETRRLCSLVVTAPQTDPGQTSNLSLSVSLFLSLSLKIKFIYSFIHSLFYDCHSFSSVGSLLPLSRNCSEIMPHFQCMLGYFVVSIIHRNSDMDYRIFNVRRETSVWSRIRRSFTRACTDCHCLG